MQQGRAAGSVVCGFEFTGAIAGRHLPVRPTWTQMYRRDSDAPAPAGLRCTGGPHLRTYAPQWALKSCASVGRWASGLSSGGGARLALAWLWLAPGRGRICHCSWPWDLRTRGQLQCQRLALSAAVSQHVHGYHHHHKPETTRGAPVVCRLSRLEIWPSPQPESRRQWESRGQGRMPQGSRGDVPPQARRHVHCDVFG